MEGGVQAEVGAVRSSTAEDRRGRARQLVRVHADFIYRCLARFGVPDDDRQDLGQEIFLVALRRNEDWTDVARTRPWLYGVARKVAAAHLRRAYRRREQSSDALDHEPAPTEGPEELTARRQAQRRLAAILDTMNVDLRAVFVMFEIEGMSGREIAELSGHPVQTIFSRLRRARGIFERAAKEEAR